MIALGDSVGGEGDVVARSSFVCLASYTESLTACDLPPDSSDAHTVIAAATTGLRSLIALVKGEQ